MIMLNRCDTGVGEASIGGTRQQRRRSSLDDAGQNHGVSVMPVKRLSSSTVIAALSLATGPLASSVNYEGSRAFAAAPQTQQELNNIIQLLQATDTDYAADNFAGAQAKYDQAKASWKATAPAISKNEANEVQELLDRLGKQLDNKAAMADVRSTISDLLDELHEDIGAPGK